MPQSHFSMSGKYVCVLRCSPDWAGGGKSRSLICVPLRRVSSLIASPRSPGWRPSHRRLLGLRHRASHPCAQRTGRGAVRCRRQCEDVLRGNCSGGRKAPQGICARQRPDRSSRLRAPARRRSRVDGHRRASGDCSCSRCCGCAKGRKTPLPPVREFLSPGYEGKSGECPWPEG